LTSIFIVLRAFGGKRARKLRAVLPDLGLKGEKAVETEVRKRVIILAARRGGSVSEGVGRWRIVDLVAKQQKRRRGMRL
jgi:hypothetical protein